MYSLRCIALASVRFSLGFLLLWAIYPLTVAYSASPGTISYTARVIAGSAWVGDGGPSRDSLLLQAEGLAADPNGNLYVSDAQTHRVRVITPEGLIRTVAGTGRAGYSGDGGPAEEAQLSAPYGLAADANGNLYIADLGNRRVRRVGRDGVITTIGDGFVAPRNLTVDRAGHVYVSDFSVHRVYRIHGATGERTVVAGTGESGYNGEGPAAQALLNFPAGLAVDEDGLLYIGDTANHRVRRLEGGVLREVQDAAFPVGLAISSAGELRVTQPGDRDIAFGPDGSFYATDGRLVRRTWSTGSAVIAGRADPARGDHGPAVEARLNNPAGLARDGEGNLYIADRDNHRVRKVDMRGVITTFAGTGIGISSGDGLPAVLASLKSPHALSLDGGGNLFITESGNRVRVVDRAGLIRTLPAGDPVPDPLASSIDAAGNRYAIDAALRLVRMASDGTTALLDTGGSLQLPVALIADAGGALYVSDAECDCVWLLSPEIVAPPPVKSIEVVNSASRTTGPVAPGSLASILAEGLSGMRVFIGDSPAQVLTESDTDLVIEVPPGLAVSSSAPTDVDLTLKRLEEVVGRTTVQIAAAAPALFGLVRMDGVLNTAENKVVRGDIVMLFGTGQGAIPLPLEVTFGGYAAEVFYSGPVPGYPGLWQINARVPGGFLAPGERPVSVSVGGAIAPSITAYIE